jgi:DNA repair protein RecO (recombination protein O)
LPGIVKTTGTVLTRYDWGNTSRIFVVLTPDRGRVSLLLKGARRPKGRPGLGGGLDLLSENEILYYQRRSGLAVLAEWSEISSPYDLARDPVRLAAAEACAEFARECSVEGDGDPGLYALLTGGVELVRRAERLVPLTLSVALAMLSVAGFRPETVGCVGCGVELAGEKGSGDQVLSAAEGGLLCRRCSREGRAEEGAPRLSAEAAALLGALVRLAPQAAARLRPSRAAERGLLRAVSHYASWRLERRIKGLAGLNAVITGLEAVGCR